MINTIPGHRYEVSNFENKDQPGQILQFIHKELKEEDSAELITISDGTTNEEVLEVLIDRMKFLNNKFSCIENHLVINHLEFALFQLNERTRKRIERNVEGKQLQ